METKTNPFNDDVGPVLRPATKCDFCGSTENVDWIPFRSVLTEACGKCIAGFIEETEKKRKRVIFVGIHNKQGKTPLDSSTRSGKVIDSIINNLPECECIKTNLHDLEYLPQDHQVHWLDTFSDWRKRAGIKPGEVVGRDVIVVLLGGYVHQMFRRMPGYLNTIKLGHPSPTFRSKEKGLAYVGNAIAKIGHPSNP